MALSNRKGGVALAVLASLGVLVALTGHAYAESVAAYNMGMSLERSGSDTYVGQEWGPGDAVSTEPRRVTFGGTCPATVCGMGACAVTQSLDTSIDGTNTVACSQAGTGTTENFWARCFDRTTEGIPLLDPLTIDSVTFGVQQATSDGIELTVSVYRLPLGCPDPAMDSSIATSEAIQVCQESLTVNIADVSATPIACDGAPTVGCGANTPVACTLDDECIDLGGTTCTAGFCDGLAQECIDLGGSTCTAGICDDLDQDCIDLGGSTCGLDAPGECDDIFGIDTITHTFANDVVIAGGRDFLIEIGNTEDGTDFCDEVDCSDGVDNDGDGLIDEGFFLRVTSNALGQCGPTYLRAPDCGNTNWDDLDIEVGFPDSHVYMEVSATIGGTAPFCGNSMLQGCEECDPPDPEVEIIGDGIGDEDGICEPGEACEQVEGDTECDTNCRLVNCGHPLAGGCCEGEGHNGPGCNDQACCDLVCEQLDLCCIATGDGGLGWTETECAALAQALCAGPGQVCELTAKIATGPDDGVDGYADAAPDELGGWAIPSFSGQGDDFNPAAPFDISEPTFSIATFLFVPDRMQRQILTENPQHLALADDNSLEFQILTEIVRTDTNGDGVEDTSSATYRIFDDAAMPTTDLTIDVLNEIEQLPATTISVLTQTMTITNTTTDPVDLELVRSWDLDQVWDPDADFADDSVGTVSNGTGVVSVFQQEFGEPDTAMTISSAQATEYYGCKGGIDPDGAGPQVACGFGTDLQEWEAFGVPEGWENFIAGVGVGMNGESGEDPDPATCDPCDAHIGISIPVSLGAGAALGTPCPDLDDDGDVDAGDLAILLGAWGPNGAPTDLDEDGDTDAGDLAILLGAWGPANCPSGGPTAVIEIKHWYGTPAPVE